LGVAQNDLQQAVDKVSNAITAIRKELGQAKEKPDTYFGAKG
jgi:hypothetical protein